MKNILIMVLAVFMHVACFAQSEKISNAEYSASPARPQVQEPNQLLSQEITELKIQNKIIREYHSSLLDTVYYALGGIVSVALLLVGLNWFSSARLRIADKEQLTQEFNSKSAAVEARISAALAELQRATLAAVDMRVDALLGRISADLLGLRGEIAADIAAFRTSLTETEKATLDGRIGLDDLKKNLKSLEAEVRLIEEKVWDTRGVVSNVLFTQAQGLRAACIGENMPFVSAVLERMANTLAKLQPEINGEPRISESTVGMILEILNSKVVQDMGGTKLAEIVELLGKTPVYKP